MSITRTNTLADVNGNNSINVSELASKVVMSAPEGASKIGYGNRTQEQKNGDVLSVRDYITTAVNGVTSNQAGIVAAVAAAKATNSVLFWPAGTYVSDASIPDFHSVGHYGPGVIKRGTDTFKMDQRGGQMNVIYVAPAGSNTNDGLSSTEPFATIQAAGDAVIRNWANNMVDGLWRVQLAAGTYKRATFTRAIRNCEAFQVWGPEASWGVPTAIINNVDSEVSAIGLYFNGLDRVHVKDIKCTNFNGNNGLGVSFSNASMAYCQNIHVANCEWAGIYMQGGSRFYVAGGLVEGCSEGIVAYTGVTFTIGYVSNGHPTVIRNCTQSGFSAYNSSAGHVDYAEISSCPVGASITNQSRVDFMGAKIMGCNVAISADVNSTYVKNTDDAVLFSSGTANTVTERCNGYSVPLHYQGQFSFSPVTRVTRWGAGWSGVSANSTYKHVFDQQTGDSGMCILAPDGQLSSLTFGRVSNSIAGRITYDHAADQWRIICNAANTYYANSTAFAPYTDNGPTCGRVTSRWSTIYAGTGTINTSDENSKQQIKPIDEACLRAWANVEYVQYKFNDAVEAKGDGARWHFGLIAQRVKKAFEDEGLNAFEYGLLCYDEWEEEPEELDEEGNVCKPYLASGSRYGIRYEEALALECAYLRSLLKK